jgi:hypothetical protein
LDLATPDHTTLSRRSALVEIPRFARHHDEATHLAIDSTGLKIVGDGEWHAHKHQTANKRRSWRKLHLGVDGDGFVVVSRLTEGTIARFTADGAHDRTKVYEVLTAQGASEIVIPPRRAASKSTDASGGLAERDGAIERIAEVGRRLWRKESGAHRQARAEHGMFRFKSIIGDGLRAKTFEAQQREANVGVLVINRMTELAMPQSVAVTS